MPSPPRLSNFLRTTRTAINGQALDGIQALSPNPFDFDFTTQKTVWVETGYSATIALVDFGLQLEQLMVFTEHANPTVLGLQGTLVNPGGSPPLWIFKGNPTLQIESCVVGFEREGEFEPLERWGFVEGRLTAVTDLSQPAAQTIAPIEKSTEETPREVHVAAFHERLEAQLSKLEQAPTSLENLNTLCEFDDRIENGWEWQEKHAERAVKVFLESSQTAAMFEPAMRNLQLLAMYGNFDDNRGVFLLVYEWAMRLQKVSAFANAAQILKLTKNWRYHHLMEQLNLMYAKAKAAESS